MKVTEAYIEKGLYYIENKLSGAANTWNPLKGILAGVGKVALGIFETTAGLLYGVGMSVPSLLLRNIVPMKDSVFHIKNGIMNIVVGSVEGIPLVGKVVASKRLEHIADSFDSKPWF